MELLRLIKAWVKSSGIVTFWRLSREGTENWGAVISANWLVLSIPLLNSSLNDAIDGNDAVLNEGPKTA